MNQQHIKRHRATEAEFSYGTLANDTQEQMEIGELGLDIWRVCMIQSLGKEIVKQILEVIKTDRTGGDISPHNPRIIQGIIQSFVQVQDYKKKGNLKLYQELFEAPMLEASGEYYKSEAAMLLQRCTVSEYMEEVLKRLDDENKRAHKFFHGSSIPKLRQECEQRMITDHLAFLHSDCKEMVSQEKRVDLQNMYTLLKPIPDGLKTLIQAFLDHIKNEGIDTISTLKGENVRDAERLSGAQANRVTPLLSDSHPIRRKYAASSPQIRTDDRRAIQERSAILERIGQSVRQRDQHADQREAAVPQR